MANQRILDGSNEDGGTKDGASSSDASDPAQKPGDAAEKRSAEGDSESHKSGLSAEPKPDTESVSPPSPSLFPGLFNSSEAPSTSLFQGYSRTARRQIRKY